MRRLIVDGYNAVHAWPELQLTLRQGSLEEARRALVGLLAVYGARREVEITVVFDAHQRSPAASEERVDGVLIRFGHRQASADHIIERAVMEEVRRGRGEDLVVATSDRLQRDMVHGMGVATMATLTLESEVQRAVAEVRQAAAQTSAGPGRSGARLEQQLDPALRARPERMRRGGT